MSSLPSVSLSELILPCETCREGDILHHEVSLLDLSSSAHIGCSVCRLRHLGVLKVLGQSTQDKNKDYNVMLRGPFIQIIQYDRTGGGYCVWGGMRVFLYCEPRHDQIVHAAVGVSREVVHRRSNYVPLITEWLRNCHENHPKCSRNIDVLLPTRVLAVSDTSSDWIHLREVSGQRGSYTALSHCWGGATKTRTTMANLEINKKGLRYDDLPLSFQHAVTATRDLGLKFLWIDALCIIQDNQDDWQEESGKMATVYKDAYLVLGADMSPNSHGGFLDAEDGGYLGGGRPIAVLNEVDELIFARLEHKCEDNRDLGHPLALEPLSQRAWTLQEQLLASKMVHFASKELIWECESGLSCQCMRLNHYDVDMKVRFYLRPSFAVPFPQRYRTWPQVVNGVSCRDITKPEDALPCLSGIAHYFQRDGAEEYLAGLWQNDLLSGLLWVVLHPAERTTPYRAPTWSWASISHWRLYGPYEKAARDNDRKLKTVYAKILEAKCVPSGKDPLGAVASGYLRVSAPLLELWDRRYIICRYDYGFSDVGNLHCLFIAEVACGANGSQSQGLIIKQRLDVSGYTFERVGFFKLRSGKEALIRGAKDTIVTII